MTPNSRSYLNHFTQPDSIVPDPSNPQDWDRYSYARNNPLKYTDPSGHMAWEGDSGGCNDVMKCIKEKQDQVIAETRIAERKCASGNDAYCSTALKHPVETAAFIGGGLLLAGAGAAAMGATTVTAETVTITTTTVEGANIACGNDMCASEAEQIVTIIGRYDANKKLAESIGANWLNIQDDVWNAMSMAERWARNKQWLQEAVIRGDVFRLASPISEAAPGSWYAKELNYLFHLGYTVTANQQYLIPPVFLP